MDVAIGVGGGVSAILGALHLVGIFLLGIEYSAMARYLHCKVDRWFAIRTIIVTGVFGYGSTTDREFGLFWNRMLVASDTQRSNAGEIQQVRQALRSLRSAAETTEVVRTRETLVATLARLRKHDDAVAAELALKQMRGQLDEIQDADAATDRTRQDVAQLP